MSISACGTVVEHKGDRVLVRVDRETCANCHGTCAKFRVSATVSAYGDHQIGSRVMVVSPANNLLVASLVVFGLPLLGLIATVLVWQTVLSAVIATLVCLLVVHAVTRSRFFMRLLRTRTEPV